MNHIAVVNPSQNAPLFAPWAESFDGNALLRTIGLVILVAYAAFQIIALCYDCFSECFACSRQPDYRQARAPRPGERFEALESYFRPAHVADSDARNGTQLFQEIIREAIQNIEKEADKSNLKDLFVCVDPSLFDFIFSSAVYRYAFGSKKDEAVPYIFKNATLNEIPELRAIKLDQGAQKELEEMLKKPSNFNLEPKDPAVKKIIASLKRIANDELQKGGLFVLWEKAAETIDAPPEVARIENRNSGARRWRIEDNNPFLNSDSDDE